MIIVRKYLTESIKTGKLSVRDILKADFEEVKKLSFPCLRRVTEEFYKNYEKKKEFSDVNEKLMKHLEIVLPVMGATYRSMLIKNISYGIDRDVEFSEEILAKILENLTVPKESYFDKIEAGLLVKFLPLAYRKKIDLECYIKRYFEAMTIKSLKETSIEGLSVISWILIAVGEINKYYDIQIEGISIYQVLENVISEGIDKLEVKSLFLLLKCFMINDRGSEDFIRKLEKNVFENLEKLENRDLVDIAEFYKKRILHNTLYVIENISKPLYTSFVSRFDSIEPFNKSMFLFHYWKNSSFFGMFCDDSLKKTLQILLRNPKNFQKIDQKTRNFLIINTTSYLAHARQLDQDSLSSLNNLLAHFSKDLSEKFYLRILTYLSRQQTINPDLLSSFFPSLPILLQDPENFSALYHIYLNLKYQHPSTQLLLSQYYNFEILMVLEKYWKDQRKFDIKSAVPSQTHKELERELREMKVEYCSEYYDEYFIDLAIPKYKICIEVSGPGHYLFPSLALNGRTYNKQVILQSKGWRYYNYPYFLQKSPKAFVSKILPFDF